MIEPRRGAGHSAGASCVGVAALQAGHHRADRRRHEARTSLRRSRIRESEAFHRRDYLTRGAVRIACSRWFRLSLFPGGHRCCERPAFLALIFATLPLTAVIVLQGLPSAAESARSIPSPILYEPANPQATSEVAILAGGWLLGRLSACRGRHQCPLQLCRWHRRYRALRDGWNEHDGARRIGPRYLSTPVASGMAASCRSIFGRP